MARGRQADESVEKRIDPIQENIRRDMQNKYYGPYPKGIDTPKRPSKKARELMKQGKPVVFT